jgi:hypothetical protein
MRNLDTMAERLQALEKPERAKPLKRRSADKKPK